MSTVLDLILLRRPLRPACRDRIALLDAHCEVTYGELGERIEACAGRFDLAPRSLVVLEGERCLEFVVTYLALLWSGHVPLLASRGADELAERWSASARFTVTARGTEMRRWDRPGPTLHPDLALLLPTSGSTGCPKLVRLSRRNLLANAASIADYLGLHSDDRAISTLPLHYCYGLSVLHSHLSVGAGMVLTESSVVDPCFRELFVARQVTNIAGVPYTFELLDRADCSWLATPALRFVTQAGGRMPAHDVRRWAERCSTWGVELFVMYGQTEATARIAYLPPHLAATRPEVIGRAIPGGRLALRMPGGVADDGAPAPIPDGCEGELVYRGPNVMLGYAGCIEDLAAGAMLDELATGDVARYHADDDVFEIIGRVSRFIKLFGVRVDLDAVEAMLRPAATGSVVAIGDDRTLRIAAPGSDPDALHAVVVDRLGLAPHAIEVRADVAIERNEAGKVDYAALASRWPRSEDDRHPVGREPSAAARSQHLPEQVCRIVAVVLGRRAVDPGLSFVALGGDSLSYVECSVRLESFLGPLPSDWHHRPLGELARSAAPVASERSSAALVDTTIALRAIAICMVVSYHMGIVRSPGGAHLMLALAGYNFARFIADIESPTHRLGAALRSAARVATPAVVWLTAGLVLFGNYEPSMLVLVHNYVGSPATFFAGHWAYWFFEVFVHLTVAAALLLMVPAVDRLHRRAPYGLPLVLFLGALAIRSWWRLPEAWHFSFYRTHSVAWFFLLGWLVYRSTDARRRVLTCALALAAMPGFFHSPRKETAIVAGLVLLAWSRTVPVPRILVQPLSTLAAASLWIYLTHFELWPRLADAFGSRLLAYAPTIAVGVIAWRAQRWSALSWRAVRDAARRRGQREAIIGTGAMVRQ